ncbi:TetR-like C-terminal domain-containing protein [Rothia nasisuis]|uniref:TetR-like C-terminal domain-containing protein n=1 Tax=Rothia nasisuis TaxID=2109647 RepID=UPI001F28EE0E|nr:TetR-like C-terminal domain-containing protein [Rothia nasisuis]
MEFPGFGRLTVKGLVNEVGTTPQTFYRRYASVALLALEVLLKRFGRVEDIDTGGLESDLLELQRNDVAMMTTTLIQKNLPGLFEGIRTDGVVRDIYRQKMISPRRKNVERVLDRAVGRGEVAALTVDAEYICDLLFGPLLDEYCYRPNSP